MKRFNDTDHPLGAPIDQPPPDAFERDWQAVRTRWVRELKTQDLKLETSPDPNTRAL